MVINKYEIFQKQKPLLELDWSFLSKITTNWVVVNAFGYLFKGSSCSRKKQGSLHSKTPAFLLRKKQMHERELRALPHPSQSTFYDPSTLNPWIHREKNPLIHIYILYFFHDNLTILSQRRHLSWGRSAVGALIPIKHQMHTWGSELLCILLDRKTTTKWGNASLKKRKHSFLFVIPCLAFWENCWEIDVAVNLRPSVTLLIEKNDLKEKKQS